MAIKKKITLNIMHDEIKQNENEKHIYELKKCLNIYEQD